MGKSTEVIDQEIKEVMQEFDCVEDIIGQLADECGRRNLVHRELRDFTWFVSFMIFHRAKGKAEFDLKFRKEYDNFRLDLGYSSSAWDLFKWACLYWIYNKKMEEYYDEN